MRRLRLEQSGTTLVRFRVDSPSPARHPSHRADSDRETGAGVQHSVQPSTLGAGNTGLSARTGSSSGPLPRLSDLDPRPSGSGSSLDPRLSVLDPRLPRRAIEGVGSRVSLDGGHRALLGARSRVLDPASASMLVVVHGVGHNHGRWSERRPRWWSQSTVGASVGLGVEDVSGARSWSLGRRCVGLDAGDGALCGAQSWALELSSASMVVTERCWLNDRGSWSLERASASTLMMVNVVGHNRDCWSQRRPRCCTVGCSIVGAGTSIDLDVDVVRHDRGRWRERQPWSQSTPTSSPGAPGSHPAALLARACARPVARP
eukprot:3936324-Rhodomonas_salina.1